MTLHRTPLDRLGVAHAVALLAALPLVALVGQSWPLGVTAAVTFAGLLVAGRGRFTPRGAFGVANAVTTTRLVLVLGAATVLHAAQARWFWLLLLLVVALDGVDGWVARRRGEASEFGAHFDVEVDALFVLVFDVELWQRGRLGAWVLVSGALRYVYVLCLALVPAPGGPARRSTLGRALFGALLVGLGLAFVDGGALGTWGAAVGTALLCASFAWSFYLAYGPSAR